MVQIYDKEERFISARFSKEGSEKVSQLAHGAMVKVRGEIYEIDAGRVRLRECDLARLIRQGAPERLASVV